MKHDQGLRDFVRRAAELPRGTKEGYLIKNMSAVSPAALLDGAPSDLDLSIPIYAAPYVLDSYGEGAIMGVPGHDERDYDFWRENEPAAKTREVIEGSKTRNSAGRRKDIYWPRKPDC